MNLAKDTSFWDGTAQKYSKSPVSDQAGYERTLKRTSELLNSEASVLELGCGTGSTALQLAGGVKSYLATDISAKMIDIANEKHTANKSIPGLTFRVATSELLAAEATRFDAVLAFNYLHLVRDLPATLGSIHESLKPNGLFISKTPCLGNMNFLIPHVVLPVMTVFGKAPYVGTFNTAELSKQIDAAGFEILDTELHATKKGDTRPYIVARKR
jgi:ubiquinone/menaquinone biosynthesis C-methylase UbiE